ncbi:hypothetical protein EI42_04276 [Thermosporothrix hazakensis]|uniref:Zinc ribbon protein n=1 Tax=Thermosporothrix hazakensis TaxID=644383 RepID=A0A326U5Y8_THEHA|nr:hypothetical protein [Thermosporothrix hazakensis]PZW25432.1 hypothetical protein EI42_04276 [Thermosporothrix hazakensis]GCE48817.1 hypothetical protein KTH_36860 [Thermosporothrix hazakensis]
MTCTHCGFSVSPARSHCPRCGLPVETGQAHFEGQQPLVLTAPDMTEGSYPLPMSETMLGLEEYALSPEVAVHTDGQLVQPFPEFEFQDPSSRQPTSARPLLEPKTGFLGGPHSTRFGFTLSALCLLAGAMILVFVAVMAPGLSGKTGNGPNNSPLTIEEKPTKVADHPTATTIPTEVSAFPGEKYIDNVQLGSSVDRTSARITVPATSFRLGQTVYITMAVHPERPGALCLYWYINNSLLHYLPYEASNASISYWFAVKPAVMGNGSVEVYWASTPACIDKQLAYRGSFNIG